MSTTHMARADLLDAQGRVFALECTLRRLGYESCDVPACNCGSWHGGHAERRMDEIRDVLIDWWCERGDYNAGNGKTTLGLLRAALAAMDGEE